MKYSKDEILEFLKISHRQRIQVEMGIPTEVEIKYDLTIKDWIAHIRPTEKMSTRTQKIKL